MHHRSRDITGIKCGFLTAVSYAGSDGRKSLWNIHCECGKNIVMPASEFLKMKQKSCGCKRGQLIAEKRTRHGLSGVPIWNVWHSMMQRCINPKAQAWKNYGGRGITVCPEWHTFENFYNDMAPGYKPGLSLDRIDVDGPYCKENCRWATRKEQGRNKRNTVYIDTPVGKMPLTEASEQSGIKSATLRYRIEHGWPADMLFIKPDYRNRSLTSKIRAQDTDSR